MFGVFRIGFASFVLTHPAVHAAAVGGFAAAYAGRHERAGLATCYRAGGWWCL